MINIYCHTWNIYLPPQGIIDGNCGYHAIRNGYMMLKILNNNIKYNSYIKSIKNSKNFKLLKSNNMMNSQIEKIKLRKGSQSLNGYDIKKIIKINNMGNNIFVFYPTNDGPDFYENDIKRLNLLLKKDNYRICFIIFKSVYNLIKHWVPIVIDKKGKNVHIHLLDSYDMVYWGESNVNNLINYLYPGNKNIFCKKQTVSGNVYYCATKIFQLLILFIAIYLFISGLFEIKFPKTN